VTQSAPNFFDFAWRTTESRDLFGYLP